MGDFADTIAQTVPVKWQGPLIMVYLAAKLAGQAYAAIVNGGGLKRIICAIWFNENVPKVIAKDYKAELSTTLTATPAAAVQPPKENE